MIEIMRQINKYYTGFGEFCQTFYVFAGTIPSKARNREFDSRLIPAMGRTALDRGTHFIDEYREGLLRLYCALSEIASFVGAISRSRLRSPQVRLETAPTGVAERVSAVHIV